MLLTFCIVNGLHAAALLRHGRGDVTAALQFMADRTPGDVITLGADHNFRVSFPARYIVRTAIPGKTIDVSTRRPWSPDGPEWYIVHAESFEPAAPYSDLLFERTEHPYKLAATFPAAPLSGFHWFVYHRQ